MRLVLVIALVCAAAIGEAKGPPEVGSNWPKNTNESQLFTLQWQPKGKRLEFKVVGHQAAEIKYKDTVIEATYGLGKNKKKLTVTKENGKFFVENKDIKDFEIYLRPGGAKYAPRVFHIRLD